MGCMVAATSDLRAQPEVGEMGEGRYGGIASAKQAFSGANNTLLAL